MEALSRLHALASVLMHRSLPVYLRAARALRFLRTAVAVCALGPSVQLSCVLF